MFKQEGEFLNNTTRFTCDYDKPHEECGVFGICSPDGSVNVAYASFNALLAEQHRGQESCGIVVNNKGVMSYSKNMGLVTEAFDHKTLDTLEGQMACAHVRYSTAGASIRENAQPLVMRYIKGALAIAHNGTLTNAYELSDELAKKGCIFQTTIDSEVIAYLIAQERVKSHSIEEAVHRALPRIEGSYSLIVMSPQKLIAARDPHGFRPLVIGKIGEKTYVFASETCALDACGATFVRDVKPGEIVMADSNGLKTILDPVTVKKSLCVFEYIYFARPDSVIDGINVYEARKRAGKLLYEQKPVEADMVIGVPESGIPAAIGYAEASRIPYQKCIIKNNYIGRTFIKPTQEQREQSVRLKLNLVPGAFKGKRVVMIDDSIVRGTTCARIVDMVKNAGAKEVHLRISSPPFLWPCYYGTDIPDKKDLIACHHTVEEIGKMCHVDTIDYLHLNNLSEMLGIKEGFCDACFSGNYPAPTPNVSMASKIPKYSKPID